MGITFTFILSLAAALGGSIAKNTMPIKIRWEFRADLFSTRSVV